MNTLYVPALIGQLKNQNMAKHLWKGLDVTSYSKNAIYHYDYLLVSAWYENRWFTKRNFKTDYKEAIGIHNVTLYGDSGGYQAGMKGFDLDVDDVVKWQTENCDKAIALDQPPNAILRGNRMVLSDDSWFYSKMEHTYKNNKRVLDLLDRGVYKTIPYFNVMHGTTFERRDVWYSIMDTLPFKRKAAAMRPAGDPLAQTFAVCHMHSRGYRDDLHVLGVGSTTVLPALVYMSKMFKSISFDSSSYGNGAIRRMYYYDKLKRYYNLGWSMTDSISTEFKKRVVIDGLTCECPVCKQISKEETPVLWEPGSMGGSLMTLHNMWLNVQYVKEITDIFNSVSNKEYKELILNKYVKHTIKNNKLGLAFEFIDEYKEKGIEKAYYKYRKAINEEGQTTIEQNTLF